jgi:hypothetical protein
MGDCICVRRGDGPEGCGICNETGTTPDIAGLCERLREKARKLRTQKERGPAFHFPWGQDIIDANNATAAAFEASADTLERQAAEIERLRATLGYYSYADDGGKRARAALTGANHD